MTLVPYIQYPIPGSEDRFGPTMKLPIKMTPAERRLVEDAERAAVRERMQMKRAA